MDRRGEAADPRQPGAGDQEPRRCDRRRRAPPAALVSQSAVGYYGDRGDALVDESTGPGTTFDSEVCVAWEAAARDGREGRGAGGLVFEPGWCSIREHGLLKQLLLPFKLGLGGPLAGGGQYMPWIHVQDEVRLLLWALDERRARRAPTTPPRHTR